MIAIGVFVAAIAALANAFSVALQASEARKTLDREALHASLLAHLAHRPRWLAGTGLMVAVWVLQVLALGFAPIAIVQPTIATSQLALLAIARVQLREHVGVHEVVATIALLIGLAAVIWAAPRSVVRHTLPSGVAAPMALVGGLAVATYIAGRLHHRTRLMLVVGAGLAYSWADFVNKLLSNAVAAGDWGLAAAWVAATVAIGALAFLEENTALQHRPTVTVAPVIAAVKVPLPVLMALWAGLVQWAAQPAQIATMAGGLALVTAAAASLGRSQAVLRTAASDLPG